MFRCWPLQKLEYKKIKHIQALLLNEDILLRLSNGVDYFNSLSQVQFNLDNPFLTRGLGGRSQYALEYKYTQKYRRKYRHTYTYRHNYRHKNIYKHKPKLNLTWCMCSLKDRDKESICSRIIIEKYKYKHKYTHKHIKK